MKKLLPEVCTIQYGFPFDSAKFSDSNGMPLIRIRDVVRGYSETYTTEEYKSEYIVHENDLLIGMDGEFNIAKWGKTPALLNQRVCRLMPKTNIDNGYLFYFMPTALKKIEEKTPFVTVKHLSAKELNKVEIPILPFDEQKKIATVLDKVSDLISLRKQQLTKLDELVKARYVEMFGDPVKNTMDWEIKPLSELGELNRGVSKARPRNSPELLGGPYPLIQTGEVANAKTYITSFNSTYSEKGLAQSKMWPKGTLCITIAANIAQTSILTFDACFPDSVVGFISRNMTNELFIHYWFSFFQKILDEQASQVAQKNINLKILSELNVIVPPLSLQNRFAAFVERVDQQKQTVQQSLEKLELMKKALLQEYFG